MNFSDAEIWAIIAALGVGTYLIRFSFLGLIGDRQIPEWILRHLRYTAVAILPGLVAPLVVFPAATEGTPEPARITAAIVTLSVGYATKSVLKAMITGILTLGTIQYLTL